ncbi:MAG: hypothetical protein LBC59_00060, partial [Chitinispirillales bacterium]|nr:hypothetical protein [Chitinispirillales bacterium]
MLTAMWLALSATGGASYGRGNACAYAATAADAVGAAVMPGGPPPPPPPPPHPTTQPTSETQTTAHKQLVT